MHLDILFYFILFLFIFKIIYLFIYLFIYFYFWLCWVFVSVRGLSLVAASGGHSSSRCAGLSLSRPLLLWSTGSRRVGSVVAARGFQNTGSVAVVCGLSSCGLWALERRLSSYGVRAQLLHGMWDLPGPGLEPVSPALAGRFSTTAPPGKPWIFYFLIYRNKTFTMQQIPYNTL